MAENSDLTLADLSTLVDVFYLGGTKNGALIGEAIVINNPKLQENFEYSMKQKGAFLAKGRLLGIQFQELFRDGLYYDLARHANTLAMELKQAFLSIGAPFLTETATNEIFPILKNEQIETLSKAYDFYVWKKVDEENAAVRIITSWATKKEDVARFVAAIKELKN